ncbi:protein tyrosine phosphatase family protein [Fundidesulfovibrio butyratiphilus]
MDLEVEIPNFFPIDERLACCGQPRPERFALLARAGFETVVNLATESSTGHLPEEPALWRDLGVEFTWLPVAWDAPRLKDYLAFEAWLAPRRPRRCLVHCALNWRASFFVCLYRIRRENVPPGQAWRDVLEVWEPTPAWTALARRTLGALSPV